MKINVQIQQKDLINLIWHLGNSIRELHPDSLALKYESIKLLEELNKQAREKCSCYYFQSTENRDQEYITKG